MKRLFLLLFSALYACMLQAVVAYPHKVLFRQPDGDTISIFIRGDECFRHSMTLDGYTLLFDRKGFLTYAVQDEKTGHLIASVHRASGKDFQKRLKGVFSLPGLKSPLRKGLRFSAEQIQSMRSRAAAMHRGSGSLPVSPFATDKQAYPAQVGDKEFPVILMEFPDWKFSKTQHDFDALMNEPGYKDEGANGSVHDFYAENSGGKLNLTGKVLGPYMASKEISYYGENISPEYTDIRAQELIVEALKAADADIDFSKYDYNGDGVVDGVHVIYAGYGEEYGGADYTIWAHKSEVRMIQLDGVWLKSYSCSPELNSNWGNSITHIGVICHELGHVLGCMDYYDTNYSTDGLYFGTGKWDVMGNGNWNNDGITPAHFNPYVKVYDFGWQEATLPRGSLIEMRSDEIFRIESGEENEYFLLENKQLKGFNSSVPASGLMIYRVRTDNNGKPIGSEKNNINAKFPQNFHPISAESIDPLPSAQPESYGSINSLFCPFGSMRQNVFNDNSIPSARALSGKASNFSIQNIKLEKDLVTFEYIGNQSDGVQFTEIKQLDSHSMLLKWKVERNKKRVILAGGKSPCYAILDKKEYQVGENLGAEDITVLYVGEGSEYIHQNLNIDDVLYYRLYAVDESSASGWDSGCPLSVQVVSPFHPEYILFDDCSQNIWAQITSSSTDRLVEWTVSQDISVDHKVGMFQWYVPSGMGGVSFDLVSSMLTSKWMDLSQSSNSFITFDYAMGDYQVLDVYYREGNNSKWKLLKSFNQRCDWQTATIELPSHSATTQIGLKATHDIKYGHTLNQKQPYILLDNIGVASKFAVLPITLDLLKKSTTSVTLPVHIDVGYAQPDECGIELICNGETTHYITEQKDTLTLSDLQPATTYMYRSYALLSSGDFIYGAKKSFTTINWAKGEGTADSPFLVENDDDLQQIQIMVDAGEDFTGLFFKMTGDIYVKKPLTPIGAFDYDGNPIYKFNGVFDGNHHKIRDLMLKSKNFLYDHTTTNLCALFGAIGVDGVVKNLTVEYGSHDSEMYMGLIAGANLGAIINCHTIKGLLDCKIHEIGGLCSRNYGIIHNCSNSLDIKSNNSVGGIVCRNHGRISHCYNYGNLTSESEFGDIGGIAAYGTNGHIMPFADNRAYIFAIDDCVNYGSITGSGKSCGGISGNDYVDLKRCVNFGEITGRAIHNNRKIGGLIGEVSVTNLVDCINYGDVSMYTSKDHAIGSMFAKANQAIMQRCVNLGKTSANKLPTSHSKHVLAKCDNPWYTGTFYCLAKKADPLFEGYTFESDEMEELCDSLNAGNKLTRWVMNEKKQMIPTSREPKNLHIGQQIFTMPKSMVLPLLYDTENPAYLEIADVYYPAQCLQRILLPANRSFVWQTVSGLEPQKVYKVRLVTQNEKTAWKEVATQFNGDGTKTFPHEVANAEHLRALSLLVANGEKFKNHTFLQTANIDLKENGNEPWMPIGLYGRPFNGLYDGQYYNISNLDVPDLYANAGLFGYAYNLKRIILLNNIRVHAPHALYAGGLAAYVSNIQNCSCNGKITGGYATGGLFGHGGSKEISSCSAVVEIDGQKYVGGLCGIKESIDLINSYAVVRNAKKKVAALTDSATWTKSTNCYYEKNEWVESKTGTGVSAEELKSEDFPQLLNVNNTNWYADCAPYRNDGYPILQPATTRQQPYVITGFGEVVNNEVHLHGSCFLPCSEGVKKGFELRKAKPIEQSTYETIMSQSETWSELKATVKLPLTNATYSFRAFVEIDGKREYGEEKWLDMDYLVEIPATETTDTHFYNVYTLNGVKVMHQKPIDYIKRHLSKGIYIVGKKKMIIY